MIAVTVELEQAPGSRPRPDPSADALQIPELRDEDSRSARDDRPSVASRPCHTLSPVSSRALREKSRGLRPEPQRTRRGPLNSPELPRGWSLASKLSSPSSEEAPTLPSTQLACRAILATASIGRESSGRVLKANGHWAIAPLYDGARPPTIYYGSSAPASDR